MAGGAGAGGGGEAGNLWPVDHDCVVAGTAAAAAASCRRQEGVGGELESIDGSKGE